MMKRGAPRRGISVRSADPVVPVAALHMAFERRGYDVIALFAPSLKEPSAAGWMTRWLSALAPVAIVNATAGRSMCTVKLRDSGVCFKSLE